MQWWIRDTQDTLIIMHCMRDDILYQRGDAVYLVFRQLLDLMYCPIQNTKVNNRPAYVL